MGMTIEEAIHHLDTWSTTHGSGKTTDKQHEEAKKIAMKTMCKYQEIEEIVKNTDRNVDTVRNALAFGDIAKVVEDGND